MVSTATLEKRGYDVPFFGETQPQGGIYFTESAIRTGDGWSASLYVARYPREPQEFWMNHFMKDKDVIVTMDVGTQNSEKILELLNKGMREQKDRYREENDESAKDDASDKYHELKELSNAIRRDGEVLKMVMSRIFVQAYTQNELEKRIMEIRKRLENDEFGCTCLLMEQKEEWQSLFTDYDTQKFMPNRRVGKEVPSEAFGAGFPFNYVSLDDERGQYLGTSSSGGNILFDPYHLDNLYRNFYNTVILGQTGFGKSTLLKKIMMDIASKGYYIRGFDKSGEFTDLIKLLGGTIIKLDGSEGRINVLEILATIIDEDTGEIDEAGCFSQHLSKTAVWYQILKPTAQDDELDEFELLVWSLYEKWGFVDEDNGVINKVTGLAPNRYPILSDLIALIESEQRKENTADRAKRLEKITLTIRKLCRVHKRIFDGHSTIPDVTSQQIVFFNIDGLSSMDKKIVDAQMFNAINLFWGALLRNGKKQKELYESGQIDFDFVLRNALIIDECHNIIKPQNPRMIEYISDIQREGRKIYLGVFMATQSLRALVPENASPEILDKLKEVFEFTQYKFYLHFDSNVLPLLKEVSGEQLTESEIARIGKYKMGDTLLSISGGENYEFHVDASKEERKLFKGGGRDDEANQKEVA